VTASTLIDVQGVAFETLTPGVGADYFVDNVRVLTPIPEPRELGFVTVGLLALVIGRKAHVAR
jgi:hypothetical protein